MSSSTAAAAGKSPSPNPIHRHHCGGAHHHHHFFYVSPHCPLHRPLLQPNNHSPSCSFAAHHQNPDASASIPADPQLNYLTTHPDHILNGAQMIENEIENVEDEDGEEGDPIFVLTDEWREFFAKSEAKRKLAKKQAKKGKK